MTLFRRLVAWCFLLGVLAVIAGGVFHWLRYRPRFSLDGRQVEHISPDGRWLATLHREAHWGGETEGPLEVWDTHSGQLLHSFDVTMPARLSPDGRYFYCDAPDDRICFIDWRTGETWTPPCEAHTVACDFSPKGRWFSTAGAILDVGKRQVCWRPDRTIIGFTGDDRYVVCHDQEKLVTVHDAATGARGRTLDVNLAPSQVVMPEPFVMDYGTVQFSADGRWLIHFTERDIQTLFAGGNGMPAPVLNSAIVSMPSKGFELWEITTGRRALKVESALHQWPCVLVSPDSKRIAVWDQSATSPEKVDLYDATGAKLFSMPFSQMSWAQFTTDSSRLLLVKNNAEKLTMLHIPSGKVLWEAASGPDADVFCGVDGNVLLASNWKLQLRDGRTGKVCRTLASGLSLSHFNTLTPDRRHAALGGRYFEEQNSLEDLLAKWLPAVFSDKKDVILVADMATGNVRLRLRNADIEETVLTLSDDGGTLVTLEDGDSLSIRVWDVDPHRAWFWAFLTAAALGLVVLACCRWRGRTRSAATRG